MKERYLIDSVILIDHLNGIAKATKWLSRNQDSFISVITRAEILAGAKAGEVHNIKMLLESFTCLPIHSETADEAAELRKKYKLKLPDAFQAALAKLNGVELATRNTKDFNRRMGFVKIPYSL